jgi:hypothetical protein
MRPLRDEGRDTTLVQMLEDRGCIIGVASDHGLRLTVVDKDYGPGAALDLAAVQHEAERQAAGICKQVNLGRQLFADLKTVPATCHTLRQAQTKMSYILDGKPQAASRWSQIGFRGPYIINFLKVSHHPGFGRRSRYVGTVGEPT